MSRDKDDRRRNRLQKRARKNNSNNIINLLERRRKKIKVSEVLKYMKVCGICLILLTLYVNIYTVTIITTTTTTTTTSSMNMNPFSTFSLYYMCQRIYFFFFPNNRRIDVNGIPIEFYNRYFFHGVREDHLLLKQKKKKKQSALLDSINFAAVGAENNKDEDDDEEIFLIGSDFYPSEDLKQGRQKCPLTVVFMDTGQLFINDILTTDTHNNNNNNNNEKKRKPTYQNSLWYSLESIAAYTPYACVLIQTTSSSCIIWDHFLKKKKKKSSNSVDEKEIEIKDENDLEKFVHRILSKKIYKNALPLFRDMIHKGYVRLNLLDPIYKRNKKYVGDNNNNNNNNRRSDVQFSFSSSSSVLEDFCTNPPPQIAQKKHLPPHNYLLHVDFWKDEFIQNVDSDTILMMRGSGNVLCHHFDTRLWSSSSSSSSSYALVGSVWPYESNENVPRPMEGMCQHMENKWNIWSNNAKKKKKKRQNNIANYYNTEEKEDPTNITTISSSGRCPYNNFIPIGTNGITLRDRKWAIKAIETCPHIKYSGIDVDIQQLNNNDNNNNGTLCKVIENVEEHVYFSTIFNGIGAPLPNIYEASIFAGEMLFPEQAFKIYYGGGARNTRPAAAFKIMDDEEKMRIIEQRWGSSLLYERMHTPWNYYFSFNNNNNNNQKTKKKLLKTIPIGVSKLDQYHPMKDLLQSNDQFHQECVFLPYLLNSNVNDAGSKAKKYKQLTRKERWRGIGT